jgi:hypothetical protein
MPGTATGRSVDSENYVTNLHAMAVELVVTGSGWLDGCLTWANLSPIDLLCSHESLLRIGRRNADFLARFECQLATYRDRLLVMPWLPG